ncbi:hypothetical protein H7I53_11765 [Mycolicibacterium pulveris]|uniref:Uncharacterized protein n=1 Tax=Mycolicibacterium pulveris TaxID=36813 RepID=A0A7I7UIJ4_MYCPV|nr:hypothetical protein [Mycolicibacterium pulveris]MCV6980896.1 hypothetical protein [Mycolicibacterium pulveris]BBY80519.1 hypothetical protein MPUL_16770 [Mycolicibacterium pulveris]
MEAREPIRKGEQLNTFARPLPTKLAAAIVAAGVVSTGAAVVEVPDDRVTPTITAEVAPASIVTDLLLDFGNLVAGSSYTLQILAEAQAALPYDLWTVLLLGQQDPALESSLISWLIQHYANPSFDYPWETYAQELVVSLAVLASALPPSISGPMISRLLDLSAAINTAFSVYLPDSTPGALATQFFWNDTFVGGLIFAAKLAAVSQIDAAGNVVRYLGYLPVNLEATFEAALRNPLQIPGLLSNLVNQVANPEYGLLGGVVGPLTEPFVALPGIGAVALQFRDGFYQVVDNLLKLLPPPVSPIVDEATASAAGDESAGEASATSDETDEADEPQGEGDTGIQALGSTSGEDTDGGADDAEDGTDEVTDDSESTDDDAETLSVSGSENVKQGNKFVPGGGTEPADEGTGGDPTEEPESPAPADPESSDDDADDADGSDSGANEGGAAA